MLRKTILFFSLTLAALPGWGQTFRWKAEVDSVKEAGYYYIQVPADLVGRARASMPDLRLRDDKGAFTPFGPGRLQPGSSHLAEPANATTQWHSFRHTIRYSEEATILEIDRDTATGQDPELVLRNTTAAKPFIVEGSEDRHAWYAVKPRTLLDPSADGFTRPSSDPAEKVKRIIRLNLVQTGFRYLRLTIQDSSSAPFNILEVGYVWEPGSPKTEQALPYVADAHILPIYKKGDRSLWTLRLPQPYYANGLEMSFAQEGPAFRREFRVVRLARRQWTEYRRRGSKVRSTIDTVELVRDIVDSRHLPLRVALFREDPNAFVDALDLEDRSSFTELLLIVENGDSPPLSLTRARLWQQPIEIRAYLKPGTRYTLLAGNDSLSAPRYDQQNIDTVGLAVHPTALGTGPVVALEQSEGLEQYRPSPWKPYYLWAGLILLAAGLGYMAVQLVKDMQKREG